MYSKLTIVAFVLASLNDDVTGITCPSTGGSYIRDPNDCAKYYQCFNGRSYPFTCPSPLVFNTEINTCDYAKNVNCGSQPTTAPVVAPTKAPVVAPTKAPVVAPTEAPTKLRTPAPTTGPTPIPTTGPTTSITCPSSGVTYIRDPNDCAKYYQCVNGLKYTFQCAPPLVFNTQINTCDYAKNVNCGSVTSLPTSVQPTSAPTKSGPTAAPTTKGPTIAPTTAPSFTPTTSTPVTAAPTPSGHSARDQVIDRLTQKSQILNGQLFLTQTGTESTLYKAQNLIEAVITMHDKGAGNATLWLGDGQENGAVYGLVSIAAFLGESMQETIQYDACDENNWDLVNQKYPLSNACGQLGQSYQDYTCDAGEEFMECPLDPDMEIKAVTHADWWGAPEPFFCGPKSKYPTTGYWDYSATCNNPWGNPPTTCNAYPGQKGGAVNPTPTANRAGRTDVENCCWWGRGVIQTTGRCNFGKLNYFLGAGAAQAGRSSPYPNINFCKNPEAICSDPSAPELKWIAGLFYWINSVQNKAFPGYNFSYKQNLIDFVKGGFTDDSFIDSVSGIVNRGCPAASCPTSGPVDALAKRRANFQKALSVLGITSN